MIALLVRWLEQTKTNEKEHHKIMVSEYDNMCFVDQKGAQVISEKSTIEVPMQQIHLNINDEIESHRSSPVVHKEPGLEKSLLSHERDLHSKISNLL